MKKYTTLLFFLFLAFTGQAQEKPAAFAPEIEVYSTAIGFVQMSSRKNE